MPTARTLSASDPAVEWIKAHLSAMSGGAIGWFLWAQLASGVYNWTFCCLLARAAALRPSLIANGFDVGPARVRAPQRAVAQAQTDTVET